MIFDEPALEVPCRICGADVGDECDQPLPHLERRDDAGDPGPFGVFDLDGDGVIGAFDPDDPGFWL